MPTRTLPKQAILIVNTRSRVGAVAFDQAVELLKQAGIDLLDARAVKDPKRLAKEVKKAIARAPMVIVGGGDGTLSSTIDHFNGRDTVFALLPLGTANSFARSLGIPLDLEGAVGVIANGTRRRIDLGCIDGDYFGNSAAIGLSPLIARTIPHKLKRYLGRGGYLLWAAYMGFRFKPFRLTVDDGHSQVTVWATEARIANGGFFGGVEMVENASFESGEIIVQVVTGKSSGNLAKSWLSNMLKLRHRDKWQAEIRARDLRLETEPRMDVTIDGEISARTPIHICVMPDAVAIATPRGA
ncbi:MAG: YegS/Rv2252/BmrU family lipid kinase [Pseudomonadota bacterium]